MGTERAAYVHFRVAATDDGWEVRRVQETVADPGPFDSRSAARHSAFRLADEEGVPHE